MNAVKWPVGLTEFCVAQTDKQGLFYQILFRVSFKRVKHLPICSYFVISYTGWLLRPFVAYLHSRVLVLTVLLLQIVITSINKIITENKTA